MHGKPPSQLHVSNAGNSNNMVSNSSCNSNSRSLLSPLDSLPPQGFVPLGGGTELGQHPAFPFLRGGSPPVGAPVLCPSTRSPRVSSSGLAAQSETTTMDTSPGEKPRQGLCLMSRHEPSMTESEFGKEGLAAGTA